MTPDLKKKRDELTDGYGGMQTKYIEIGFDACHAILAEELAKVKAERDELHAKYLEVITVSMEQEEREEKLEAKLNDAAALIERKDRELSKQRQEIETLRGQRDRLAGDALAILSANGIATPEKGYVDEPYMLAIDIKTLARERDSLRAQLAEETRLHKVYEETAEALAKKLIASDAAFEALSPKVEGGEA